jgi:hypothetical protein
MKPKLICGTLPVLAALFLAGPAFAQNTWYVKQGSRPPGAGTQAHPYTSIQYALDATTTQYGDTILVAPGTYEELLRFTGKAVTVMSMEGPELTVIDAKRQGSVVTFLAPTAGGQLVSPKLLGFTLTGGSGSHMGGHMVGGGVFVAETYAALENCILHDNRAEMGAGVYSAGGTVTLSHCTIEGNVAGTKMRLQDGHGGALYAKGGALGLHQSVVRDNKAGRGGGLYLDGVALQVVKSQITANLADVGDLLGQVAEGGGMFVTGASLLDVLNTQLGQNMAFGEEAKGGAVRLVGGKATFDGCSFVDNAARDYQATESRTGWGAGMAADGGAELLVTKSEFRDNWAPSGGAGAWGSGEYRDCEFEGGRSGNGAGVYALEGMKLVDCTLQNNEARSFSETVSRGGAVYGPAELEECVVSYNTAWGEGGGVFGAKVYDSTLYANRAVCPDIFVTALGGGACDSGLVRCRLIENFAGPLIEPLRTYGFGGGASRSNLGHCVVARNKADRGGGVHNSTVEHTTIALNEAQDQAGGVFYDVAAGGFCIHNSIVWDNGELEILDLSKGGQPVTYSNVRIGWRGTGNIAADPMFWGAGQLDFYLKPGSPCIDTGDARGRPDPDRTPPDMGALHYDPAHCGVPTNFCMGVKDSNGCTPVIGYEGLPAMQGLDDFRVTAADVLSNTTGVLMWSLSKGSPVATNLQCYLQCLEPPIFTTPPQNSGGNAGVSDCSGSFSFHFSHEYMNSMGLGLGTTVYCQYWYRDSGGLPPANMGRTDALEFTICPVAN